MTIRSFVNGIPDRVLNVGVGLIGLACVSSLVSTPLLVEHYINLSNVHHAEQVKADQAASAQQVTTQNLVNSHTQFFDSLNAFERYMVQYFNSNDSTLSAICNQDHLTCTVSGQFPVPPVVPKVATTTTTTAPVTHSKK
jgi:hypothetical protein